MSQRKSTAEASVNREAYAALLLANRRFRIYLQSKSLWVTDDAGVAWQLTKTQEDTEAFYGWLGAYLGGVEAPARIEFDMPAEEAVEQEYIQAHPVLVPPAYWRLLAIATASRRHGAQIGIGNVEALDLEQQMLQGGYVESRHIPSYGQRLFITDLGRDALLRYAERNPGVGTTKYGASR